MRSYSKLVNFFLEQEEGLIECGLYGGFGACGFGWVGDTPVYFFRLSGKDGAGFASGLIADGDDEVKSRFGHVIPRLAMRLAGIESMPL